MRELLRVLNRGEAVNAMKRALYAGRVAGYQAKRDEEMQAVADALPPLGQYRYRHLPAEDFDASA